MELLLSANAKGCQKTFKKALIAIRSSAQTSEDKGGLSGPVNVQIMTGLAAYAIKFMVALLLFVSIPSLLMKALSNQERADYQILLAFVLVLSWGLVHRLLRRKKDYVSFWRAQPNERYTSLLEELLYETTLDQAATKLSWLAKDKRCFEKNKSYFKEVACGF